MFCQNCKTPLRPDTSLDDLNPAAFNLLVDSTSTGSDGATVNTNNRPLFSKQQKILYDRVSATAPGPSFKRTTTAARNGSETTSVAAPTDSTYSRDHPAMSFIMLAESQVVQPVPDTTHHAADGRMRSTRPIGSSNHSRANRGDENLLSHKMETTARLFEVLSSRSDIDHPICTECTATLIEGLEKRLANTTRERDTYAEFLKDATADIPTDEEQAQAQSELASLRNQEAAALAELESLEAEKADLDAELAVLERESRALDEEEAVFWRERNAFATTLSEFQAERDSVNLRYDADARQLERLQRTNVYNDTFCISHNGFFGTINNLRLGRLPGHGVEWAEINAALGLTCLLVATVADKLGYTFQSYRLHPMGSTSTVERITEPSPQASTTSRGAASSQHGSASSKTTTTTSLPLYHSNDSPLNLTFLHGKFDTALIGFLECIRQLGEHVSKTTRGTQSGGEYGLQIPYEIKKDRIGDLSIKLGGGGLVSASRLGGASSADETWTKACKLMLTCCKFLLAHASNVRGGGATGAGGEAGAGRSGGGSGGAGDSRKSGVLIA